VIPDSVRVLERVTHRVPLGIRFRDDLTGRVVGDGLDVRLVEPLRSVSLHPNRSGVFFAHDLHGLRPFELDESVAGAPHRLGRIEVRDHVDRFHAFSFDPGPPFGGLVAAPPAAMPSPPSPPADDRFVPLCSTPARPVPAGTAAVRARLTLVSGEPAAGAALLVTPAGGSVARGVANAAGDVLVLFPYPEPHAGLPSPPPGSGSLSQETWTVTVAATVPTVVSPPGDGDPPDLSTFLDHVPAQLRTAASPTAPVTQATLRFGVELVLRSPGPDPELVVLV
jgi:hypothetical protein